MKVRNNLSMAEIDEVLARCSVCHIGMVDSAGLPYVLPFNYCYHQGHIYIHGAGSGKKVDIWRHNPQVCVEFSTDYSLYAQDKDVACSHSMRYRSVLMYGEIAQITKTEDKLLILRQLMLKYTQRSNFTFSEAALNHVAVYKIAVQSVEGKVYGY